MHVVLSTLLILQLGCCTDEGFEIKTVNAGEDVTLSCYNKSLNFAIFFWIKLVPGKMPEILGKGFSNGAGEKKIGHFTTKEEEGKFILHSAKAKPSDSAFYNCLSLDGTDITFIRAVFLEIKGPHSDFPAVVQSSVDPVSAGDVVALQCSVLSEFKNDACPEEQRVFWFRKNEGESHPTYIYARRSSDVDCDGDTETQPLQSCVYSFLKKVSSSDAGLYYCAVAACGKVVFGNGTKLDVQGDGTHDYMCNNIFFFLFFGTLVFSLMMVTFLFCVVSKKSCDVCKGKRMSMLFHVFPLSKYFVFLHISLEFRFLTSDIQYLYSGMNAKTRREIKTMWFMLQQSLQRRKLKRQGEEKEQQRKRPSTVM
uniref:Ig-like domain-containing protein n=1 Tax=Oryzias latipes TaxID=8090 RepID=H2MVJ0_ORYLA